MPRRRREHSSLLKASKILLSLGASVNLTLSHRRRGVAGSAAPAVRNADATSPVARSVSAYRQPLRDRKFADSPLEERGFEPLVPRREGTGPSGLP